MRFVDDDNISFCLTISTGIRKGLMLRILGDELELPHPQRFDDFVWETHQPGKKGLLNLFNEDPFLVTIENNGYLGVTRRTINQVVNIIGVYHYAAIYHSIGNGYQYVEIQDGMVLADFDPSLDEAPEAVSDFFPEGCNVRKGLIDAIEYRMDTKIKPEWLETPTETHVIDYNTNRD